jgi:multiple sugar transport system ATP-binding protein
MKKTEVLEEKQASSSKDDVQNVSTKEKGFSFAKGEYHSVEVSLQNLTKVFVDSKGKETVAVNHFSVVIPAGKLIGLLGPSGCGKSTTLYMIAGLHKPTEGQIFFGDEDVTLLPPEKRGIGLVFQNYALYPHLTVQQNIMFPLENIKMPKQEALQLAQEMAELVHIGDLMNRKPGQLSGGQQQRVAIARALVKKPRVLLLDEPLSNLDARLRLQTREEIKRIQRETGITTIFVTHDQEEAMSISDEIVVMNYGIQQQKAHPQEVYDEPVNMFVAKFLGNPPINILEAKVEDGKVKLLNDVIIDEINAEDQEVFVGVRPEFFGINSKGIIPATIDIVEHIGRDTMAICKINGYNHTIRAIIPTNTKLKPGDEIKLSLSRFYVFKKENGERIK